MVPVGPVGLVISIHAPVKGATVVDSTLGRVVRISIHAPVKGATPGSEEDAAAIGISIHAPVKGATLNGRPLNSYT